MRLVLLAMLVLSGCDCGQSHTLDASQDAGLADVALPDAEPLGVSCTDLSIPADQRCIEEGWFNLAQWSPFRLDDPGMGNDDHVRRLVYLDTYLIDATEVTNDDFGRWAREHSRPLPDCRGAVDTFWCVGCSGFTPFDMASPWRDGRLVAGYENHPVACVSKVDAESYCDDHGGRLPTVHEWLKSAQGPHPSSQRYPWGESIEGTEFAFNYWSVPPSDLPLTTEVGRYPDGASEYGVLDLSGGVSEFVSGCPSEIVVGVGPLLRPVVEDCDPNYLVAGSNWLSVSVDRPHATVATATFAVFAGDDAGISRFVGPEGHVLDNTNVMGVVTEDVEEGRSWRVGFRCAHDP